jgi:hypothetical protein
MGVDGLLGMGVMGDVRALRSGIGEATIPNYVRLTEGLGMTQACAYGCTRQVTEVVFFWDQYPNQSQNLS